MFGQRRQRHQSQNWGHEQVIFSMWECVDAQGQKKLVPWVSGLLNLVNKQTLNGSVYGIWYSSSLLHVSADIDQTKYGQLHICYHERLLRRMKQVS